MNLDDNSLIEGMGAKVLDNSSLNTENKTETPAVETKAVEETPEVKTETTETPASETTTETKSETTETPVEKTETPVTETTETKTEETTDDSAEEVAEKVKGWDMVEQISNQFKEKTGISLIEANDIVNTDFNAMDESDLIEEYYRFDDEGITDNEIRSKMRKFDVLFADEESRKQLIEDGKYSAEQIDDLNAEFEGLKRKALNTFDKLQTDVKGDLEEFQIENKNKQENNADQVTKMIVDQANQYLTSYSKEKIEVRDGDKVVDAFEYNLNDTDKTKVSEVVNDPSLIYKLWMDDKGLNVEKMVKDIAFLRDKDKIIKLIYNQALAKGASKEIKDLNNASFDKTQTHTQVQESGIPSDVMNNIRDEMGF